MKSSLRLLLVSACFAGVGRVAATPAAVNETRYAWEFPAVNGSIGADALIVELRAQVQRILDAGRLAPLYISTSDQESVGYTIYQEPGRILTTLAWAYPHLTAAQQSAVRDYANTEFADPRFSPWGTTPYGKNGNTNFPLPHDAGAPREDHPKDRWWYTHSDFGTGRPFLHPLYGVWLYGWRTGDWTAIQAGWPAISTRYLSYATAAETRLYGGMGGHVAIARLAQRFGDATVRDTALTHLRNALTAGLDFETVELLARGTPGLEWQSPYGSYPNMYDSRMEGTSYRGWMFLNLTPEIGRYLNEENAALRAAVLTRHALGKQTFPLWWLPKVSYFTRSWTGDEGSGLLPEVVGMIAPVERWVVNAPAAALARQTRGSPWGRGDCYWLEAVVQAIEAHGTLVWRDVRYPGVPIETWRQTVFGADAASAAAQLGADWDGDGIVNLGERALGLDPRSPDGTAIAHGTTADGYYLTATYTDVKEAWDIEYVVETSADGSTWHSGPGHTVVVSRLDQGTTSRVTVRDAVRQDLNPPRFLRLRVRTPGFEATLLSTPSSIVTSAILIDFGSRDTPTASPDANGRFWNNLVTDPGVPPSATLPDLITETGLPTGIALAVANFAPGPDATGTSVPEVPALGPLAVASATRDGFSAITGTTATITLANLAPDGLFRVTGFGSHDATDIRVTRLSAQGANAVTATVQTTGAGIGAPPETGANRQFVAVLENARPAADGQLILGLTAETGGSGYLNAWRLERTGTYSGPPPTGTLILAFDALTSDLQHALITWSTGVESNVLGFHLERQEPNGTWATISPSFIPATGTSTPQRYRVDDPSPQLAMGTPYRLLSVDRAGALKVVATTTLVPALQLELTPHNGRLLLTIVGEPNRNVTLLTATHLTGPWTTAANLLLDARGETTHPLPDTAPEVARFFVVSKAR